MRLGKRDVVPGLALRRQSARLNVAREVKGLFGISQPDGYANGMQRHVEVDEKGRYMLSSLPVGVYTVTLEENGKPVVKHPNVGVIVNRGIKVDFDCAQGQCGQLADNH